MGQLPWVCARCKVSERAARSWSTRDRRSGSKVRGYSPCCCSSPPPAGSASTATSASRPPGVSPDSSGCRAVAGTDLVLLALLTALLVLVAVYGYRLITKYERIAFIGMGISLVIVAIGAFAGGIDWGHPASVHGAERLGAIAVLVTALGVGWGVSWTPFAHDFGRFVRRDAPSARSSSWPAQACTSAHSAPSPSRRSSRQARQSSLDVGKTVEAALPEALAWPVLLVMTLGLLAGQPRQPVRRTGGAQNCGPAPQSPPGRARSPPSSARPSPWSASTNPSSGRRSRPGC